MSGRNIHNLEDNKVFLLEDNDPDEMIFCQYDLPNNGVNTAKSDSTYRKPDHEQYFFSTMEQSCYVMYANNMVTPVRPKGMLRHSEKVMGGLHLDQNNNKGIYVVEYFRISKVYGSTTADLKRLLDYYYNTMNIYPDKIHIKDNISKRFEITKRANMLSKPVTLKIITFIKQEDIIHHRQVYVPTIGVIIGAGTLDDSIKNNVPKTFSDAVNNGCISDVANFIEINIVDYQEKYHYMKLGNKVLKLESYCDRNKTEGASVITYRGEMMQRVDFFQKDDLMDNGIFLTEAEADTGKVNLEKLKMELEYKKLMENNRFDQAKKEVEVKMLTEKYRNDLCIQQEKTNQEKLKTIDAINQREARIRSLEREAYLMEKKIELEEEKAETQALNSGISLVTKMLGIK